MRVLIVHPSFYVYGGAEILIVRLCNYLSKKNIENAILTTSMLPEIRSDFDHTKIHIEKNRLNGKRAGTIIPGQILALMRGIYKLKGRYDVINVHNFPANLIALFCSESVVWMCNEPELYFLKTNARSIPGKIAGTPFLFFEKFIVKHYIDRIIVADKLNSKRFKKNYNANPDIVHYGIDYDRFALGSAPKEKKSKHQFIVLQVGMLTPFKNQMESLNTVRKLKNSIPGLLLILAGYCEDKQYKAKIDKYILENRLEKHVMFTGHIDRKDLRHHYHTCDVLIHPVKSQGGWLAPFEVLSAGKSIIVSPEMTASNIIKREKIGIVTDNYVNAVIDVYQNQDYFHKMALRGKRWVCYNLTWNNFGARIATIFRQTV